MSLPRHDFGADYVFLPRHDFEFSGVRSMFGNSKMGSRILFVFAACQAAVQEHHLNRSHCNTTTRDHANPERHTRNTGTYLLVQAVALPKEGSEALVHKELESNMREAEASIGAVQKDMSALATFGDEVRRSLAEENRAKDDIAQYAERIRTHS